MKKPSQVARFIESRIKASGKTQKDIAREVGFEAPNMITMIKQGHTKVPLTKIGSLALALESDPIQLLKMCMDEYYPETWNVIAPMLEDAFTHDEIRLMRAMRSAVGGPFVAALTQESRKHLDTFIGSLRAAPAAH